MLRISSMIDEYFAIEGNSRNSMHCKYTPNERKVEFLVLKYVSFYEGIDQGSYQSLNLSRILIILSRSSPDSNGITILPFPCSFTLN